MKSNIFERVLSSVSLDPRIKDGTFKIEDNEHMEVLREYFVKKGIEEASVIEFCNKVIEGKYPERQAYNAKGILVTFPTPEYKAEAIKRGTHFEEDPTKRASNVFQNGDSAQSEPPAAVPTPAAAPKQPSTDTKTNLPMSQASPAGTEPTAAPETPAAPSPETTTAAPQQQASEPEPEPIEPTELPPPTPKSPAEKQADKMAIKSLLKGDDYMLEQVVDWVIYNGPEYLINEVKKAKMPDIRKELYESANSSLHTLMLFSQGALPKKEEVKKVADRLQNAINSNSDLRL